MDRFNKREYEDKIIFKLKGQMEQAKRKGDMERLKHLKSKANSFLEHKVINYPALIENIV